MQIQTPCLITPRLLPGIRVGDAIISIEYARGHGTSCRYRWHIDAPVGEFSGDDLRCYRAPGVGLQDALRTLCNFLAACAESYAYDLRRGGDGMGGENSDIFPAPVAAWAHQNKDELDMAGMELETPGLIVEK